MWALASATGVEPGVARRQALQQSGRRPGRAWERGHGGTHGTTLDLGGPLPPVQVAGGIAAEAGPLSWSCSRLDPGLRGEEGDPSTRTVVQQVSSRVTSCPMH